MKHYFYGVICQGLFGLDPIPEGGLQPCGIVELSPTEYTRQLSKPDSGWLCPRCGGEADWDDDSGVCS